MAGRGAKTYAHNNATRSAEARIIFATWKYLVMVSWFYFPIKSYMFTSSAIESKWIQEPSKQEEGNKIKAKKTKTNIYRVLIVTSLHFSSFYRLWWQNCKTLTDAVRPNLVTWHCHKYRKIYKRLHVRRNNWRFTAASDNTVRAIKYFCGSTKPQFNHFVSPMFTHFLLHFLRNGFLSSTIWKTTFKKLSGIVSFYERPVSSPQSFCTSAHMS